MSGLLTRIMDYRDDRLRHKRIAHHALVQREKSQVLEVLTHSSHADVSTSKARAFMSSSSRRRRVLPTNATLSPSSYRRQVSVIQAPEVPESSVVPKALVPPPTDETSDLVPPPIDEVIKPMPPLIDEIVEDDDPPQALGGGPVELSLLPLYPDHTSRHIWDGEVILVGFVLFKLHLLLYSKFLTLIYFYTKP